MKMEPNGSIPPSSVIMAGSINHFFSGIGRGTALILQGLLAWPERLRPRTVPTSVNGSMTNRQMQAMATWSSNTVENIRVKKKNTQIR